MKQLQGTVHNFMLRFLQPFHGIDFVILVNSELTSIQNATAKFGTTTLFGGVSFYFDFEPMFNAASIALHIVKCRYKLQRIGNCPLMSFCRGLDSKC